MTALENLFGTGIVERLGWTLVHTLWQGVAFALVLALLLRLMRNAPAAMRYLAACAALASMVLVAVVTFALLAQPQKSQTVSTDSINAFDLSETNDVTPLVSTPNPEVLQYVVTIWSIGVLALSIWHVAGWLCLRRLCRGPGAERWQATLHRLRQELGVNRFVRVIESASIDIPAVIGVFKPVILLPPAILCGLSANQVEALLAHELAHIRRHDYLINLVQAAIETVMFYHPATWWISAQIRQERENCCDDLAADVCGNRRLYAGALAALERQRIPSATLALAAGGGNLNDRIRRLFHLPPAHPTSPARSLAAAVLAIACGCAPLVATSQYQSPAESSSPAPTTAPAQNDPYHYARVIVARNALFLDGKPAELLDIKKSLSEIPADRRRSTVLAVSAAAPNVTVQRFFDVSNQLSAFVKDLGLAYLSQTGIERTPPPRARGNTEAAERNFARLDNELQAAIREFASAQAESKASEALQSRMQALEARMEALKEQRLHPSTNPINIDRAMDYVKALQLATQKAEIEARLDALKRQNPPSTREVEELTAKKKSIEAKIAKMHDPTTRPALVPPPPPPAPPAPPVPQAPPAPKVPLAPLKPMEP